MIRQTDDIVSFENFLTPDECSSIIRVLELQAENRTLEWTPISFYESYSSNLPKDNDPELAECGLPPTFFSDLQNKIRDAAAQVHGKDPNQMSKIGYHTQKWEPGAYATPHSDNTDANGNPSPFERSRYAVFVYLNEDFEGGILNFTTQGVAIKPSTGLLAAFAGGHNNLHEVTLVTKGVRYTLGSFWDDREESDYPEELREKWKAEMLKIREAQVVEKTEWQEMIKSGYKLSVTGEKYKIEEVN